MSEPDDLRDRLARLDPVPAPLDPVTSPRASELLERTMSAPVLTHPEAAPAARPARSRRLLVAAAAVAVLAAGGAAALVGGGDEPAPAGTSVTLALPGSTVAASCAMFDVAFLRDMSPAFAGTVAAVDGGQVVLDVDRWYAGGDAARVVLEQPDATSSASLDGTSFVVGERYLVTAAGGTVNGCGYTGPATPELQKAFDDAFGG